MLDLDTRMALLQTALLCGGLFAAYRVFLTVLYPMMAGAVWQTLIGPVIHGRWPSAAQNTDKARPSYLPLEWDDPYIVGWGLFPPPIDDITHGIRDGLLLGVGMALLPELVGSLMLTTVLFFVALKWMWRIARAAGSNRTDYVVWAIKDVLVYAGAIAALAAVGYL